MKNKRLLFVWENVSTMRRNICKKLRRFMRIFLLLQALHKWIPPSFALRYHSHKQIPHNVALRHYTDKYIT